MDSARLAVSGTKLLELELEPLIYLVLYTADAWSVCRLPRIT